MKRLFRVVAVVSVIGLATLPACNSSQPAETPAPPPPEPEPDVAAAAESDVAPLTELAAQFDQLEAQQTQTNRQIADLLARYQKRGGALPPGFGPDLTDEQRTMLAERIKTERAGTKALLEDIIAKDKEHTNVRAQLRSVQGRLPAHVIAKEGDRHDRIAMDFLMKRGVSAAKAYELISQINLQDALVPGFRVWTHYQNGQFGTWVTAGGAGITPQQHQLRLTEMLRNERNEAIQTLEKTKTDLEDTRTIARAAEEALEKTAAAVAAAEAEATKEREENARRMVAENTIRYVVGSKKQLENQRIIDGRFRLRAVDGAGAQTLNLLESSDIAVDGIAYGMKRVRKVTLVPEVFANGVDYTVTTEGPFARVKILQKDKFAVARFLAVVLE
jgi:hypothetical protein